MKTFLFALISFLLIGVFVVTNGFICAKKASDFATRAEDLYNRSGKQSPEELSEDFAHLQRDWNKFLPYLQYTLHHNYQNAVETLLLSVEGALLAGDSGMLSILLSELHGSFTELSHVLGIPQM